VGMAVQDHGLVDLAIKLGLMALLAAVAMGLGLLNANAMVGLAARRGSPPEPVE